MSHKKFVVTLTDQERQELTIFINTGIHPARAIKRARMLLLADGGDSDPAMAEEVGVCLATVFNTRRRYCTEGIQAVLTEKPRPGQPRKLDGHGEAQLTAIACSEPPEGRVRWTTRLLADKVVELALVETFSHASVGRLLKKTS
jgi:putative transposase